MLPRLAPTSIAMSRPSPSHSGTLTGPVIGPRRKELTSLVFHSNPPVAMMTPLRARMRSSLPSSSVTTPMTRRPSVMRCRARDSRCNAMPRSMTPFSSDPISAWPCPRQSRASRSASSSSLNCGV